MTATALQEIEVSSPRRKWPRYSEYRPLKEAWLDKTPAHWSSKRLKFAVALINSKQLAAESDLPYVGMENIDSVTGRYLPGCETEQAADGLSNSFQNGDVLFGKLRPYLAKALSATFDGLCSSELLVFRPRDFVPQYLLYLSLTKGFVKVVDSSTYGAKMPRASWEFIGNLRVPIPPLDEQRAIAAFLDRETARIDALIAMKERVIELLKEKRQAAISRAVTKGLDPNAPMKPSGIDWLGDVPAHWRAKRLRFSMQSIEQGWSPQCDGRQAEDDEWGVLKVGCVNGESFDPTENKALPHDLKPLPEYEIKEGDLLMSRANTRELLGSAALVGEVRPKLLLCDKLYRIHVQEAEVLRSYLLLFFESSVGRFQFERDADGTSGSMKNIGQDTIKNMVMQLPPVPEQRRIVAAVTKQQTLISDLRVAIDSAIRNLRDHRSALITAAVTGQIDVRNCQKEAPCP